MLDQSKQPDCKEEELETRASLKIKRQERRRYKAEAGDVEKVILLVKARTFKEGEKGSW